MKIEWSSLAEQILFWIACGLAGLAIWEKLANALGRTTLIGPYVPTPSGLFELAMVALVFMIAVDLREIRRNGRGMGSQG
jgi:hypothetical protein